MTYLEQALTDPALRAFIEAEIARAGIDVQSLRVESDHQKLVISSLKQKVAALEARTRARK